MVRGREEMEWERASHLMAVMFNSAEKMIAASAAAAGVSMTPDVRQPRDFNPFHVADDEPEARIAGASEANARSAEIIEREAARGL